MTFVSSGSLPLAAQWCARRTAVIAGLYLDFLLEGAYGTLEPASVSSRQQAAVCALVFTIVYFHTIFTFDSENFCEGSKKMGWFEWCLCQNIIILQCFVILLDHQKVCYFVCTIFEPRFSWGIKYFIIIFIPYTTYYLLLESGSLPLPFHTMY